MKNVTKVTLILMLFGFSLNSNAQFIKDVQQKEKVENVSAQDFSNKIDSEGTLQLIDIRTMGEYKAEHLIGARLIDYYNPNFSKNIEAAGYNKNTPVYIYCRSGSRSGRAIALFKKLGFKHIINLAYGINDWNRSSFPLEK
jgi:rhodanese-related sulfurtransferase